MEREKKYEEAIEVATKLMLANSWDSKENGRRLFEILFENGQGIQEAKKAAESSI